MLLEHKLASTIDERKREREAGVNGGAATGKAKKMRH